MCVEHERRERQGGGGGFEVEDWSQARDVTQSHSFQLCVRECVNRTKQVPTQSLLLSDSSLPDPCIQHQPKP